MDYRDMDFEARKITLDGNTFTGCTFRNCEIIFRGTDGPPLTLVACHFKEAVQWVFDGAASRTLNFLTSMYRNGGEDGRRMVDDLFENVRRGDRPFLTSEE